MPVMRIKNLVYFNMAAIILLLLAGCLASESPATINKLNEAEYLYAFYDPIEADHFAEYIVKSYVNPFFFPQGTIIITYEGGFWLDNEITQNINLNINLIKAIDDGYLYSLHLDQLEYNGPFSQLSSERLHLGFFYVTPQAIYRRRPPSPLGHSGYCGNFSDYADRAKIAVIEEIENQGVHDWGIVSSNDVVGSVTVDGQWRSYVEIEGNRRIFSFYSVDSFQGATRFYERIVWEEGRGIIHYLSGFGAMREHIEIQIAGTDIDRRITYAETFVNLLQNKLPFILVDNVIDGGRVITTREPMFLSDFLSHNKGPDYIIHVTQFAIVDMDGDGMPEVILEIFPGGDRLVLHYRNGRVFGNGFPYRGLRFLKTDGTFYTSGGAATGSITRLRFEWDYAQFYVIYDWGWTRYSSTDIFYFNRKPVSLEEFYEGIERAMTYLNSKENATWHPFYGDWIKLFE